MSPLRRWHVWLLVVPLYALVGAFVYARLVQPAAPLNFDEAAHSLPAFYLWRDVRNLDARAFWGDFHIQTLWPPGFSLLQAPFLAVFGRTDEVARMFAFAMIGGCILCSWSIVREVARDMKADIAPAFAPLAMLIVALLHLSAPGWLFVGSWAMQETPVAFVQLLAFWCLLVALRTQRKLAYFATSLLLLFLFLTKYNYAAFALAAAGLVQLGYSIHEWRTAGAVFNVAAHSRRLFYLVGPFALGVLAWFFTGTDIATTATKWRDFAFFVTNENSGYDTWSAQNLLFYVRAGVDWVMAGPILAVPVLAAAVWAVFRVRHRGVALLALYFAIGFVLASLHQLKANRYITPIFPALWLLAALGAAQFATRRISTERDLRPWFMVALGLALAGYAWFSSVMHLQPVWVGAPANGLRAAGDAINNWQQPDRPVLVIGTFGELGPPYFEWRLRPRPEFANQPDIQYDAPPGQGTDLERVKAWLAAHPRAQVTLLQVDPSSPFFGSDDMQKKNLWKQTLAAEFERQSGEYRRTRELVLADAGLRVSYWVP